MKPYISKDLRYEIKFVASELEHDRLLQWIYMHPACFVNHYQDRQVNNIYFDSHNYSSYSANIFGFSSRTKVRYRWYGLSIQPTHGALEIKYKRNFYSWKNIYKVDKINPTPNLIWPEFKKKLNQRLTPVSKMWLDFNPLVVLINRYKRKYFICASEEIRVTLDSDIQVYSQEKNSCPNYSHKENIPRTCVLEFKFPPKLRKEAADIIRNIPIRVSRHSKYINGLLSINR